MTTETTRNEGVRKIETTMHDEGGQSHPAQDSPSLAESKFNLQEPRGKMRLVFQSRKSVRVDRVASGLIIEIGNWSSIWFHPSPKMR
jgi:hypothetical protein